MTVVNNIGEFIGVVDKVNRKEMELLFPQNQDIFAEIEIINYIMVKIKYYYKFMNSDSMSSNSHLEQSGDSLHKNT
jgi:hypothetical protein